MLRSLPILLLLGGCLHHVPRVPANNAHVTAHGSVSVEASVSAEAAGPKVQGSAQADADHEVFVELDGADPAADLLASADATMAAADATIDSAFAATDEALAAVDGMLGTVAHPPSMDVSVSVDGHVSGGSAGSGDGHGSPVDGSMGADGSTDGSWSGGAGSADGAGSGVSAGSGGNVDGRVRVTARAQLDVLGEAEAPERLAEGDRGVRATGRGRARLGALVSEGGLEVDGTRTRLDDLAPLAETHTEAAGATTLRVGGHVRVSGDLEVDPNDPEQGRVVVRVRGDEPAQVRARVRVHLVVDASSSMHRSWPDVQAAARTLVERLDPRDEVHVVAYDADAEEVVPLGPVGDGRAVLRAIARISVGGGTNIEAGLGAAYRAANEAPTTIPSRVILLSDGVPNGGAFTAAELAPMAARASAAGCLTSTIGIGDSFDADVLRGIARSGSGGYHVALEPHTLAPNLAAELDSARLEAAARVKVRLSLGEGIQLAEGVSAAALAPEVRGLAAGEERRFVIRVRLSGNHVAGARVRIRVRLGAGARIDRAEGTIRGRRGIATVRVAADADLAGAADAAAAHLNNGRAEQASAALLAHANRYARYEADARLRVRVGAVRRIAEAVRVLTPRTSHTSRRRVALAMGELASRLLR